MEKAPRLRGHDRPRYRRVSTRVFGDERFRQLSAPRPNGQTLWMFLLVGPQTRAVPGLFTCGQAGLAEMLAWPIAGFRHAWKEIEHLGMAQADWNARVVWVPNALRHNPPESPNVIRSWRVALEDIPECDLKRKAVAKIEELCEAYGQAFVQAFRESSAKPSADAWANQEQEQEQDQDQEQERTPQPPFAGGRPTRDEIKRAKEIHKLRFGCNHDPRCEGYQACLHRIVEEIRKVPA